jgi:rhodanese-related sulfurtransferase
MRNISVAELDSMKSRGEKIFIADVRTPAEYQGGHIPEAVNLPLGEVAPTEIVKSAQGAELVVVCQSGGRSVRCCQALAEAGYAGTPLNLQGGTQAWKDAGKSLSGQTRQTISLERQVRIGAGALVLAGVAFGFLAHPGFFLLSAFVGAGLIFAGVTDWCGMALLLAKMPWNQVSKDAGQGTTCQKE